MRMPTWFRASRVGGVPLHWTPSVWQGWAVVGAFVLAVTGMAVLWVPAHPGRLVGGSLGLVVVLTAVAALTDGDAPEGSGGG